MKKAISLALLIASMASGALAQGDPIKQARRNYDECVYGSVGEQIRVTKSRDMSMMAEQAFMACATEEGVIRAILGASTLDRGQIEVAVLGVKNQIKKSLREIAANPAKFAK